MTVRVWKIHNIAPKHTDDDFVGKSKKFKKISGEPLQEKYIWTAWLTSLLHWFIFCAYSSTTKKRVTRHILLIHSGLFWYPIYPIGWCLHTSVLFCSHESINSSVNVSKLVCVCARSAKTLDSVTESQMETLLLTRVTSSQNMRQVEISRFDWPSRAAAVSRLARRHSSMGASWVSHVFFLSFFLFLPQFQMNLGHLSFVNNDFVYLISSSGTHSSNVIKRKKTYLQFYRLFFKEVFFLHHFK